jgi:hypothetical protein
MFFGEPFGGIIPGARGAVLAALVRTGGPVMSLTFQRAIRRHVWDPSCAGPSDESPPGINGLGRCAADCPVAGRA